MKKIAEIYGCIYANEKEYNMDGESVFPEIDPATITSIGEHEIGDEANVFIVYSDSSNETLTTVQAVVDVIKKYNS